LDALWAAAAAVALCVSGYAQAQAWPSKPISIVNVFSAGGPGEVLGRTLAGKMTQSLGTQVIVDSRPGAGGAIATTMAATAAPDGYTILLTHLGSHAIVPALRSGKFSDASSSPALDNGSGCEAPTISHRPQAERDAERHSMTLNLDRESYQPRLGERS
jgi:tripartite-type tricarboxylate transporter receptor subunit TctC